MKLVLDRDSLRSRRLLAGLTQVQLAAKVGVHPITLVRYETGSMAARPDKVARLAKALGCTVADLAHIESA